LIYLINFDLDDSREDRGNTAARRKVRTCPPATQRNYLMIGRSWARWIADFLEFHAPFGYLYTNMFPHKFGFSARFRRNVIVTGVFLLVLSCSSASVAQTSSDTSIVEPTAEGGSAHPSISAPVLVVGSLATTAILFKTDQQTSDALFDWKNRNHFMGQVSHVVTNLGDGGASLAFFGGTTVYSLAAGDNRALQLGKIGLESYMFSGTVALILKETFGRQRPNLATRSGGTFYGPLAYFRQTGTPTHGISFFDSFPSGHTTSAFAAATTISDYFDKPWVTYTSYSVATIVGISRITERMHWASDVFVGGIIGYYSTKFVEHLNYGKSEISVLPSANDQSYAVTVTLKM